MLPWLTKSYFYPAMCDMNFGCLSFHRHLGSDEPGYKGISGFVPVFVQEEIL